MPQMCKKQNDEGSSVAEGLEERNVQCVDSYGYFILPT